MKKLLIILLILPLSGKTQQLADRSPFNETSFIWNPAMTAIWDFWEVGVTYRQQWLGFEDAPRTATLNVQYPFNWYRMSLGGFFMSDNANPIKTNTFGMTYAYKMELDRSKKNQLSLGLLTTVSQFFVDVKDVVLNHPDDPLLPTGENNKFFANVGGGAFYTSYASNDFEKNFFFAGLAFNQVLPTNTLVGQPGEKTNLKRAIHGNAIIGTRLVSEDMYLEPSLWVNYSQGNIWDLSASLRFERFETFWTGLAFSSNQTLSIQGGWILNGKWTQDGTMRIGTLASFNIGTFGRYRGLGFEFYAAYRFIE